jgi:hypothetical protein
VTVNVLMSRLRVATVAIGTATALPGVAVIVSAGSTTGVADAGAASAPDEKPAIMNAASSALSAVPASTLDTRETRSKALCPV